MKYFAKLCFMISGNKNYKFNDYGIPYLDLQEFENLKKDIKDFKDLISAYESNNADPIGGEILIFFGKLLIPFQLYLGSNTIVIIFMSMMNFLIKLMITKTRIMLCQRY